jgi:hypothetical protein
MSYHVVMATGPRAVDRLDDKMRHELANIVASWRMENQPLSEAEIEVLALYLLGEIDAEERQARMTALLS